MRFYNLHFQCRFRWKVHIWHSVYQYLVLYFSIPQIFLQGAATIFGVGTEIKFLFKPTMIEATLKLELPVGKLGAEVYIKASYGMSLKETGFTAKVTITSGLLEVSKLETSLSSQNLSGLIHVRLTS